MLSTLRRLFSPPDQPAISDLEKRIRVLEAERLELITEWVKTRDQVLRYMKRAGALRPRVAAPPDEQEDEPEDELGETLNLVRAKYGV